MNTEATKDMLKVLNHQRNLLIEELRSFKQLPVNRKRLDQSVFSKMCNHLKSQIKDMDEMILGLKEAHKKSNLLGQQHTYNFDTKTIEPVAREMYAVFNKRQNCDEDLQLDLGNLISIFPEAGDAIAEAEIANEWSWCKVKVSVTRLEN